MIVKYNRSMRITNLESLPAGTGAKYLYCLIAHNGDYIAHSWKRKIPAKIESGYILIDFTK